MERDTFEKSLKLKKSHLIFIDKITLRANHYEELITMIPKNYIYKENLAVSLFNLKDFKGSEIFRT